MKNLKKLQLALFSLVLIVLYSCNDSNNDISSVNGKSTISVKLTDMPGDFDHVYVEVLDVMIKVNDNSTNDNGWQSIEAINTGVYDLLELTGGVNVLLADNYEIPSGMLNQIRLVLGDDNTVVIDGETLPINTPSAQQSGLKIKVNQELQPDTAYTILLDFNVDQSVKIAGNSGNIILKPVIRTTIEAIDEITTGSIEGNITPVAVQTEVSIISGTDIISSFTDADGNFLLSGVPAGTYDVTVTPDPASGFSTQVIENVDVTPDTVTNIGTIVLE